MVDMTQPGAVLFEVPKPHIALVTINRPEARNAVNGAVATGLEEAVERTENDPDLWVAVLTGSGPHAFCAGADLARDRLRPAVRRRESRAESKLCKSLMGST